MRGAERPAKVERAREGPAFDPPGVWGRLSRQHRALLLRAANEAGLTGLRSTCFERRLATTSRQFKSLVFLCSRDIHSKV